MHSFQVRQSKIWWLTFKQLKREHSKGPYINFFIIVFFFNKFWSHPSRSTNYRLSIQPIFSQLDSKAKICNFYLSRFVKKDIITLYISMNLSLRMQRNQSNQCLLQNVSHHILRNFGSIMINKVSERTTIHILYKHKKRLFIVVCKVICLQTWRSAHFHHSNFCFYFSQSILIFQFNYSASIPLSILLLSIKSLEYFTYSPFTQLFIKNEFACWVLLNKLNIFNYLQKLLCSQQDFLNSTLLNLFTVVFNQFYCTFRVNHNIILINFRCYQLLFPLLWQVFYSERLFHIYFQVNIMFKINWTISTDYVLRYFQKLRLAINQ